MDQTSTTLLAAIRSKDDDAWQRFERNYRPIIAAWCRKMGASPHDADEVSQMVLIKLLTKLELYDRSRGRFRSWLAKMSANCWRDLLREQNRQLPSGWQSLPEQFSEVIVGEHDNEVLQEAQRRVRPRVTNQNWNAFWMVTYDEVSAQDVAAKLGCSKSSIYQAAYRIREMLKTEIENIQEQFA